MEDSAGDLCRLCLGRNELVWIFDETVVNNVQDIIHTTSGVKILATDIVSQKVCATCLQITIKMYKFRTTALKNDRDLKAKYKQLEPNKRAAETSALRTTSPSTSDKPKTTAEIDIPPQGLSKKQEKKTDRPQNIAAPNSQPHLKKIHPSVMKIMRDYPDYKLPKIPMNEHYSPVITLVTNEVDNWFKKHKNYSDSDIERLKQFAANCQSTPITTCPPTGSKSLSSSSSSVANQQGPVATAKRRKDVTDVRELPTLHQVTAKYQCDNKKIRLSGSFSIRPVNSANSQAQLPCAESEGLTSKQTSVGTSISDDESEDFILELSSKTGQFRPKSSSNMEVCGVKSAFDKLKMTSVNSEAITTVDNSRNQKDSAVKSDYNHRSVGTENVTCSSGTNSIGFEGGETEPVRTWGSSKKRKKFVIDDSDDDTDFDLDNVGDVVTETMVHSHTSQQQLEQRQTAISVDTFRSPITFAKRSESEQQTTTDTSNVVVPSKPTTAKIQKQQNLGSMLDSSDFFAFRCTECPATYDRLLDFNLHVRLHADKEPPTQYGQAGTDAESKVVTTVENNPNETFKPIDGTAVLAPAPSPTPSTSSNCSDALSFVSVISSSNDGALPPSTSVATTTATDDVTSTSTFLIPKNNGSKLFACRICDSMHYSRKDLKIHVRKRHTRCQFCAARFETPEQREEHINLRCGITRVHRNLKAVKIELTKVDLDEEIKRKYPEAFGLPSGSEADALEEPPVASELNSSNEDLFVQEDPGTKTTAAVPQDDVICISDDETSDVEFVIDEPQATTIPEPQSPKPQDNVVRPNVTVVGSNFIQDVNIHDDDRSIMKYILTKLVQHQEKAWYRPTDKDIVEGNNSKSLILKNLRRQLYRFNIPVEISHSDKLQVSYKYDKSPAKLASNDHWNLLPPKKLLTKNQLAARKNLLSGKAIKLNPPPSTTQVVGTTNVNVTASNKSTVQTQTVESSKTTATVSTNNATAKISVAVGNAQTVNTQTTSTLPSTADVAKKIRRTFGPAKPKNKNQNPNQKTAGNQQHRSIAPRPLSAQPSSSPAPTSLQNSASTSSNNNNDQSQQQNYVILTMGNEGTPELVGTQETGQQPQLPIIQSVCTVNEPHVISASNNQPPYVAVSLQQNGLMPAPGIIQTTSAGRLSHTSTTSAIVTPQQHVANYSIQTVTNNLVQQPYVNQPTIVTQNDLIQASQATTNLALTSDGNFVQYTQSSVVATTSQATCFLQPTPVPQHYTITAPQPVPMVPTATNIHNPPPYQVTAAALPQQLSAPINRTFKTYPIQKSVLRKIPSKQSSTTAPVAGSSAANQQTQQPVTQFQPIKPRQVLSPKNTNEASKEPKNVVAQPKNSSNSDFDQLQVVDSNTDTSQSGDNADVIQTSAQKQPEPVKIGSGFTIRVKNLSELS